MESFLIVHTAWADAYKSIGLIRALGILPGGRRERFNGIFIIHIMIVPVYLTRMWYCYAIVEYVLSFYQYLHPLLSLQMSDALVPQRPITEW